MSKSKLRKEYEARMGTVDGNLQLFNEAGTVVYREEPEGFWILHKFNDEGKVGYYENSLGSWAKYEHNDEGKVVYYENSEGMVIDNRPPKAKIVTDQDGKHYELLEVIG